MKQSLTSLKVKFPLLINLVFFVISIYWLLRTGVNTWFLLLSGYTGREIQNSIIFGHPYDISFLLLALNGLIVVFGFLLSTRIKLMENKTIRKWYFQIVTSSVLLSYVWLLLMATHSKVIPYLNGLVMNVETEGNLMEWLVNDDSTIALLIMGVAISIAAIIMYLMFRTFQAYQDQLTERFYDFKWNGKLLQRFSDLEDTSQLPDVKLGENTVTREMVVQPGKDRTLNNIIIGSIGTGKTAALGLPIINQDLHHITRFINKFPELVKREDYDTEEVKGSYMNGISIIEPSNDLCQKSLQLVQAHDIPKEAITYINPLDPNTPSFNPMKGPVEKVAEAFAQVIEGLNESGDSGNFYFEQAQRNHLKHYIYLLKMHKPDMEVTFDMLLDMYNNSQVVRHMHLALKERIPDNIESIEDRDEYNRWKIIQQIDEWFDQNLLPSTVRGPGGITMVEKIKEGKYRNEDKYFDAKAEHVQGLRNILNDIGANTYIRRVLFGKSDFSFDVHLERGGILLVNTAKGEIGNLSNVFGKIVLLSLQNAVLRRPPNISPYHHILIDEAPDYLYQPFREFPAQSRKYKAIITIICQTIAQMADRYGEHYLTTLVGTLRHRMVYGDVPNYDAEYFSKMFGEKFVYEESTQEQVVSPLQDDPTVREGTSYQKKLESSLSASEVMYQDAFQCAVKIVAHNKPLPVQQIKANFVPEEDFIKSKIRVNDEAAHIWLKERKLFENNLIEYEVNDETKEDIRQMVFEEKRSNEQAEVLDEEYNQALSVRHGRMPKDKVKFSSPLTIPISNNDRKHESSRVLSTTDINESSGAIIKSEETVGEMPDKMDWLSTIKGEFKDERAVNHSENYKESELDESQTNLIKQLQEYSNNGDKIKE